MDQTEEYGPPPNPAKVTDTRAKDYRLRYGDSSWELDALEPAVIEGLIRKEIQWLISELSWNSDLEEESREISRLRKLADEWNIQEGG